MATKGVPEYSERNAISLIMWECTQETNPSCASFAGSLFLKKEIWTSTSRVCTRSAKNNYKRMRRWWKWLKSKPTKWWKRKSTWCIWNTKENTKSNSKQVWNLIKDSNNSKTSKLFTNSKINLMFLKARMRKLRSKMQHNHYECVMVADLILNK